MGAATTCSPDPCAETLGACCALDGGCALTTRDGCLAPDTWLGPGLPCAPNPCPQPTGACCTPDAFCTVTFRAGCPPPDLWLGAGSSCQPDPCPAPIPTKVTTWGRIKQAYR